MFDQIYKNFIEHLHGDDKVILLYKNEIILINVTNTIDMFILTNTTKFFASRSDSRVSIKRKLRSMINRKCKSLTDLCT
jgi:hypothetical protein